VKLTASAGAYIVRPRIGFGAYGSVTVSEHAEHWRGLGQQLVKIAAGHLDEGGEVT
jgi:hypothetical protein